MRPTRSLLAYLIAVFLGGALLAPWLYWFTLGLAAHWPVLAKLASNPFHRFFDRSLLVVAVLGLWPLLRSCDMASWGSLGLRDASRSIANVGNGFVLGFGSLASVALLAVLCGGRTFNPAHSRSQVIGYIVSAVLTALIVSVLEEIIFRGTLFGILKKTVSCPGALVISSAVYALAHFLRSTGAPGHVDWLSGLSLLPEMFQPGPRFVPAVLTLFMAGAILALAYQRTGAIFFSIGLHSGWIFWLKSYGFLTVTKLNADSALWGTDKLIDGWLAPLILGGVCWIVARMKRSPAA